MNTLLKATVVAACAGLALYSPATQAQQPDAKELKKAFAVKGTHRAPFKKAKEAALTSVNLQFKLATRQEQEKRGVGNIVTWGFLEGIDDALMQEIADEYYTRLAAKFREAGISLNDSYKQKDNYKKLVEGNSDRERENERKNWGVSKIFTANNAPYIEYPTGMIGSHSKLGNELDYPVGQMLVTIDFIDINQKIKGGTTDLWGYRKDKFETDIQPIVRIEGVTSASIGKALKGDGTYAKFTGGNWGYSNAIMNGDYAIVSDIPYAADLDKAAGMPESMKKFKSAVVSDLAGILSRGAVKSGRGTSENTFTIYANPQAYKAAVLNALDKYNAFLIAYIKENN